ncbi:MAG TPA: hypothetical protein VGB74_10945 [Actinoplanes sp.]|jgi:hypothetical protein
MRRRIRTTVLLATTAGALGLGAGISAWANWVASAVPAEGRATVSQVPTVGKPDAKIIDSKPTITWPSPAAAPDRPFDGYVLIRRNGTFTTTVCTVAATTRTCRDANAPAGATLTYIVRATEGPTWIGPDSEPSASVLIPGVPPAQVPGADLIVEPGTGATPTPTAPDPNGTETTKPAAPPTVGTSSPAPPPDVDPDPNDDSKDPGTKDTGPTVPPSSTPPTAVPTQPEPPANGPPAPVSG